MRRLLTLSVAVSLLALPVAANAARDRNVVVAQGDPKGSFEVVGHEPLGNRGMNAALAVHGDYVYVGSRTDAKANNANNAGVMVIDASKPTAPKVVHQMTAPEEANPGETSRELRVWHSQDLLIVMNLFSNCGEIHGCTPVGGADNFRFYDISGKNAAKPKLVSEYQPSADPHEFYLWEDPKNEDRALLFISTPGGGATQLLVTDISQARKGKVTEIGKQGFSVGEPGNDNRLHSLTVTPDGRRAYFAYLEAGVYAVDTSEFATGAKKPQARLLTSSKDAPKWPEAIGPGVHSAVPLFGKPYLLATDEVYGEALRPLDSGGCPWGWTRLLDVRDPAKMKVVAEYKLPQNDESYCTTDVPRPSSSYAAHNPTLTRNLALISWHAGGLQAVDISDPTKPAQAAEWKPDPLLYVLQEDPVLSAGQDKVVAWSFPVVQDGLIYLTDVRNGLYILRYKGPFQSEVSSVDFLEGNSNQGAALELAR